MVLPSDFVDAQGRSDRLARRTGLGVGGRPEFFFEPATEEEAARLHLFATARGIVSAGVRLGIVGPLEAQATLLRAGALAEAVRAATAGRAPEEAAASSPLLDLVQSHQDRLYSRLFQS